MDINKLNDPVELPDSLSGENVKNKLSGVKQNRKNHYVLKSITAIVCAIALLVGGIHLADTIRVHRIKIDKGNIQINQPLAVTPVYPEGIKTFDDYGDILGIFRTQAKGMIDRDYVFNFDLMLQKDAADIAPESSNAAVGMLSDGVGMGGDDADRSFSETNLQVEGIDEADIIKTNGEYIFIVGDHIADEANIDARTTSPDIMYDTAIPYGYYSYYESGKAIQIIDINNLENPVLINTLIPKKQTECRYNIKDMYLSGDTLAIVLDYYIYSTENKPVEPETGIDFDTNEAEIWLAEQYSGAIIYDISDINNITETARYTTKGYNMDSRLVNGNLILINNYYVDVWSIYNGYTSGNTCIPSVITKEGETYLNCDSIIALDDDSSQYINLLSVALDGSRKEQALSILGESSEIFCNGDNLYVTSENWSWGDWDTDGGIEFVFANGETYKVYSATTIFKFDIANGSITFTADGTVPGVANGSFALDEYKGYFRTAVTVRGNDFTRSAVFVLDKDLNIVGSIDELQAGEEVKGVRFIGDTAYVVTFMQTDPLFVLDMSDPTNPVEKGQLKITGFSDYLHPYGEYMIGIGYDGTEDGLNGGSKFSLFNVSDMTNPTESDRMTISNATIYNFSSRAFTVGKNGMFGVPIEIYKSLTSEYYYDLLIHGIQTFSVVDGKLVGGGFYEATNPNQEEYRYFRVLRGIIVNDYMLVVTEHSVDVYKIGETTAPVKTLTF
ncbi:MAG TPA: hypothetical protein GXZ23_00735 [Clostridiales bacterium]|nr:hypothetical protein [Clostridiales bacterium]